MTGHLVSGLLLNSIGLYALLAAFGHVRIPDLVQRGLDGIPNFTVDDMSSWDLPDFMATWVSDDPTKTPFVQLPAAVGGDVLAQEPVSGGSDPIVSASADPDPAADARLVEALSPPAGAVSAPIHIPTAQSRPRETKTFVQEVSQDTDAPPVAKGEVVAGYVLGEQGVSDEMRQAWSVLERAAKQNGDPGRAEDPAVFGRAAGEIGYVPTGVDPDTIRRPGAEVGSGGNEVVSGHMEVISADTGSVDGVLIRLQGIRAPAQGDLCRTASGKAYDCAAWSMTGLETIISGRDVTCEVTEQPFGAQDAHIGWCSLKMKNGKERDLGEISAEAGLVVAFDVGGMVSPYLRSEQKAQAAKNGLWSGEYEVNFAGSKPAGGGQ